MSVIVTNPDVARLADENKLVAPGTPLAMVGLWLAALRGRFARDPQEPLPWVWDPSLQPVENPEDIPPPPDEPRKLMIEAALNVEKAERNYRPAIFVNRGDIVPPKNAVDNFVGAQLRTGLRAFHSMAAMPILFECESENAGESSLIADTAWFFVLSSRDIFRSSFHLHEITNPVMGPTQPTTVDKEVWRTTVSFQVQFDLRWTTKPIAPFLNDLLVELRQVVEEGGSTTEYLHKIVLRESES